MSSSRTAVPSFPRNLRETQRRSATPPGMSQERLAADLAAFQAAGGQIEVLGNTRTLKKILPPEE